MIDIVQTFIGVCDLNDELWKGYAKIKRSFEFEHIQRLHMEFMHEVHKSNPDQTKLTNIMKAICIYAHIGLLPDDKRLELFRINRTENEIVQNRKKEEG